MGRNNNNAGMHYIKYTHYGSDENLSYYNKISEEGILNRRSKYEAELARNGEYLFAKYLGIVRIKVKGGSYSSFHFYKVFSYDENNKEYANEIKRVSSHGIFVSKKYEEEIKVRVHDRQSIIYISNACCDRIRQYIDNKVICSLLQNK